MSGDEGVTELAALRTRLVEARTQTVAQIAALTRNFDGIVEAVLLVNTDDEHDPEGATIAFERAQVSALLRQANTDLASIDEADDRLSAGTYGRCTDCGAAVGAGRLEAIPSAARCIHCAARSD